MIANETVAAKIRDALQQVNILTTYSGVSREHLSFVRKTLTNYLRQIECDPTSIASSDLNLVSRLVIEYCPLSLPAGEAVIAAEQAMRTLDRK
jgi:hypothetical protein